MRRNMFLVIAVLHVLVLVSTFLFLPKGFIPKPKAKGRPTSEVEEETEAGVELIASEGKGPFQ